MNYDEAEKLAKKFEKKAIQAYNIDEDQFKTACLCGFWKSMTKSFFRGETLEQLKKVYDIK